MIKLNPSLSDFMISNDTKVGLHMALQGKRARTIQLGPSTPSDRIQNEINMALDFSKNSIQLNNTAIEITVVRGDGKRSRVVYPARCTLAASAAQRAATFLSVMKTIQTRMLKSETTTIRDVYYSNVELYKRQQVVSDWISTFEQCFGVEKSTFRIVAAQKGIISTPVPLKIDNTEIRGTNLIPYITTESAVKCTDWKQVNKVVILEKDAVFHKLARDAQYNKDKILVTGKGYPDHLTRIFLRQLLKVAPAHIQVEAFCDSDPYGIDITLKCCEGVGSPTARRLNYGGIFLHNLLDLGSHNSTTTTVVEGSNLQDISPRDWKMSQRMLQNLTGTEQTLLNDGTRSTIIRELQRQLMFLKKGEMNVVME
ncbi:DNA topoisomerase (ATP-hydrolyzing) Ecym_4458 [Eremothecium cymbalariae DBVPG|uniref:DNA topoisomerase (ATP-hydrolyzing) n=1 Tax=Eremothecium cymbalariae (strain CBS 270.75 / DBVPG 7215 / KCTC 17166 / NRRL Y-17582) TaxID=931890 RepID=G8JTZ7_ERECY|nr:hypothetical protein Ecym_4458 [Eremothecium cymbalariae DBVPG\